MAKKTADQIIEETNTKKRLITDIIVNELNQLSANGALGVPMILPVTLRNRIVSNLIANGIFPAANKKADWTPEFQKYDAKAFDALWFADQMANVGAAIARGGDSAYRYGAGRMLKRLWYMIGEHCRCNGPFSVKSAFVPDADAGFKCESFAKTANKGGYRFRTTTTRKVTINIGESMLTAIGDYMLPAEVFMYNENMLIYSIRGIHMTWGIEGTVKILDCSWIQPHGTSMKSCTGYIGVYSHGVKTSSIDCAMGGGYEADLNTVTVYHSEKSPADAYNGVLRKAKKEVSNLNQATQAVNDKPLFTKTVSLRALRVATGWCQAGCNAWISENMPDYIGKTSAPVSVVLSTVEKKEVKTRYDLKLIELLKGKTQDSEVPVA